MLIGRTRLRLWARPISTTVQRMPRMQQMQQIRRPPPQRIPSIRRPCTRLFRSVVVPYRQYCSILETDNTLEDFDDIIPDTSAQVARYDKIINLINENKLEEATAVLRSLEGECDEYKQELYSRIALRYLETEQNPKALEMIEEALKRSYYITPFLTYSSIRVLTAASMGHKIIELYYKLKDGAGELTLHACKHAVKWMVTLHRYDESIDVLEAVVARGIQPDFPLFSKVYHAARHTRLEVVQRIFTCLRLTRISPRFPPFLVWDEAYAFAHFGQHQIVELLILHPSMQSDQLRYHLRCVAYAASQNFEMTIKLLQEADNLGYLNIEMIGKCLDIFATHLDVASVEKLFNTFFVERVDLIPDAVIFGSMLRMYASLHRREEAYQMIREMFKRGLVPRPQDYVHLLRMLASMGDEEEMNRMFDDAVALKRLSPNMYHVFFVMYAKQGREEDILLKLADMEHRGISLSQNIVQVLSVFFALRGDFVRGREIVERARRLGIPIDTPSSPLAKTIKEIAPSAEAYECAMRNIAQFCKQS